MNVFLNTLVSFYQPPLLDGLLCVPISYKSGFHCSLQLSVYIFLPRLQSLSSSEGEGVPTASQLQL